MEHCSFCAKPRDKVAKLAMNDDGYAVEGGRHIGQAVAVCNECAEVVTDMADFEQQQARRGPPPTPSQRAPRS